MRGGEAGKEKLEKGSDFTFASEQCKAKTFAANQYHLQNQLHTPYSM